jgi:WS/DGAT/MGAT family acyltransferase
MAAGDRLTGLDAAFLALESGSAHAHMHVGAVLVFEGAAPSYDDLVEAVVGRLHLVPRYRQRLYFVPFGQGRPEWADDPGFDPRDHIRHVQLAAPGDDEELARLAGHLAAEPLDRARPLWEMVLVDGLAPAEDGAGRFAIVARTHHALVDGVAGVAVAAALFDTTPEGRPPAAPASADPWVPRAEPTATQLLGRALARRAAAPLRAALALEQAARAPGQVARRAGEGAAGLAAMALAGLQPVPSSPLNVPIGAGRRLAWVDAGLDELKAVRSALGGTVNDVILAAVTLAIGRWLRARGDDTAGLGLRALIPVSVRAESERGALGNRVAAMWATLPVGCEDPIAVHGAVAAETAAVKRSGQAVGARALTQLADLAGPAVLGGAARLQARRRWFNVVVTNVPGPREPLHLLGRRLRAVHPIVPLASDQALAVAIVSYAGRAGFGLVGDRDALPDLDDLAEALRGAIGDLAAAARASRG